MPYGEDVFLKSAVQHLGLSIANKCVFLVPKCVQCAEVWLMTDLIKEYTRIHALELSEEIDYSIALVRGNPHHKVCTDDAFAFSVRHDSLVSAQVV